MPKVFRKKPIALGAAFILVCCLTANSVWAQYGGWAAVSAGGAHTAAIRTDGSLWAWGDNFSGQLGDGSRTYRSFPVRIGTGTNWATVSAGSSHTAAITTDGTLWVWGQNDSGQLGDGTTTDSSDPVRVGTSANWAAVSVESRHTVAIKTDGSLWEWGWGLTEPVQVGTDTNWAYVSAGDAYVVAIRTDGTLWAWGLKLSSRMATIHEYGESPVQIGTSALWARVSAGDWYTAAIKTDGTLWAWGWHGHPGAEGRRDIPVQIGTETNWASVSVGRRATATRTDGSMWAWELDWEGQREYPRWWPYARAFPVVRVGTAAYWAFASGGSAHTAALKKDGTLWTWGGNLYGQLGDGTTINRNNPVQIDAPARWVRVSAGARHTTAIRENGTLWAWGHNFDGELGGGITGQSNQPVRVDRAGWATVSAGSSHTAAIAEDGSLWAWGSNVHGQLGADRVHRSNTPVRVGTATNWAAVSAGTWHTMAIRDDGTLWAWGLGHLVGDGTTIEDLLTYGPSIRPVAQVGTGAYWAYVSASGGTRSMAIRTDGTLWAWGANHGFLGDGTRENRNTPVQIGSAANWASVSAGRYHTAAVRTDGTLWAWGANGFGQLGDGSITRVDSYWNIIEDNSRISPVQIGTATNWASVSAGEMHTVALKTDGTLWVWGSNWFGQLGDGTACMYTFRAAPAQVGTDTDWIAALAGGRHTVAIRADGTLWAWGCSEQGQVGDGTGGFFGDMLLSPVQIP